VDDFDLSVFVEFGVGLAGFSGVVVAFGQGSGRLSDYDRFRVVALLMSALTPAFLGLLPLLLAGFDITGPDAWRIASIVLMVAIAFNMAVSIASVRGISSDARASLSPTIWRLAMGSSSLLIVWNGLNLVGWPRALCFGPVVAGMAWFLVMASLMFFRLILVRLGSDEEGPAGG